MNVSVKTQTSFSVVTKVALITAIILWASAFVGIRVGLKGYSPGSLALLRFLIASLCMALIYWRRTPKTVFKRKDLYFILLFGVLGIGCYNVFLNYGELHISAGIASFIISQSPLISMLCAVTFLGETFNPYALIGILISIVGVGLITLCQVTHVTYGIGMIFILLATIVSGLYSVLQKSFLKKYHAFDVTVFIIWGGTLALLIFIPQLLHDIKTASANATIAAVYLGIFPAAIAYVAWSYALSAIPASRCVSFLYFMPVIATLLGWLCLGEVPAMLSLVGGVVALLGVWVANRAFLK